MGCGASKAAQVVQEDITIKDYPISSSPHRHNHAQSDDSTSNVASDTDVQISPEFSNQSTIERAVLDLTISGQPEQHLIGSTEGDHEHVPLSSTDSLQRPIAFEVCMSSDGPRSPKKAPPRLLAKMESTSKVTSEQLAQKQKVVEERKQKELDKRANSRISRKERLRKEVMAAREMDQLQQQNSNQLQSEGPNKEIQREEQTKNPENRLNREEYEPSDYFQGSYNETAEIEVDSTYNKDNEEQVGIWDDADVQDEISTKEQNKNDDFFDDQQLTNSLEQYM